jgi:hypothetical protein
MVKHDLQFAVTPFNFTNILVIKGILMVDC